MPSSRPLLAWQPKLALLSVLATPPDRRPHDADARLLAGRAIGTRSDHAHGLLKVHLADPAR
jgi:hypothetical protein